MASQQLLIFAALLLILKSCTCQVVSGASASSVSTSSASTSQSPTGLHGSNFGLPALITPISNTQPILNYNNLGQGNYGSGYNGHSNIGSGLGYCNRNVYSSQSPIVVDTDDDDSSLNTLIYLLLLMRNNGNGGAGCNNGGCGYCGNCGGNGGGNYCGCRGNNGYHGNNGGSYGSSYGCSRNGFGYDSGHNYNGGYSSSPVAESVPYVEEQVIYPGSSYSYCEPREINLVIKTESCNSSNNKSS